MGLLDPPALSLAQANRRKRSAPRVADGVFAAVDQALAEGRAAAVQVESDSTGNATGEWVYMLTQWLAARWPAAHVKYKVADQTPPYAFGAWEVMQAGAGERHAYFGTSSTTATKRTYYTPYNAFTAITGDLDVRVRLAPTAWSGAGGSQAIIGRWGASGGTKSWMLDMDNSGKLRFQWSADGTATVATLTASAGVGFSANTERWVRAALDVDNGSGGYTITLYTSADAITWTQQAQSVTTGGTTSLFNPGAAQDYEIGGFGFTGYLLRGGKIFEAQIRNGIDGPIQNPQPIESWIPRNASSPYEAGEFRGGATLYVVNGAVSGADAEVFLANDTYFYKLVPPFPGSLVFISCGHNDNNLIEGAFIANRDGWQSKIDARCPGNQTVWLTQNPKFAPSDSATIDSVQKHGRRMQLLRAWTARKGVALIDTYKAFLDDGRPLTDLVQSDGVHPTQGSSGTGSALWRDTITAAWDLASPK